MKPIGKSEDGELSEGELEKRRLVLLQQLQQENWFKNYHSKSDHMN